MKGARKNAQGMITEPRNMVIYVAGYPAIMGLQPLYFLDSELARRARIKAKAAHAKKLEDILTPADKTIKRQKRKLSGGGDRPHCTKRISFIFMAHCRVDMPPHPRRILPPSGEKRRFSFLITERMRFFSSLIHNFRPAANRGQPFLPDNQEFQIKKLRSRIYHGALSGRTGAKGIGGITISESKTSKAVYSTSSPTGPGGQNYRNSRIRTKHHQLPAQNLLPTKLKIRPRPKKHKKSLKTTH